MSKNSQSGHKPVRNVADIPPTEEIIFAVCDSFGMKVLVARCRDGICAVFADEREQYVRDQLAGVFPQNKLVEDTNALQKEMEQVLTCINF